ncbi:AEC family transporter [Oceanobacillus saliphilus]|uniref:AEC family transporter n=1 Tax=Oceanobacillus saliphilus TaxID=2925834 RepID=UPI00201DFCD7|nr:AEC family transporter [Oceanobacillus saliphilus]
MLSVLFSILLNVIFPVFILLGAGIVLHRIFTFDLNTLSKITMYYLLPVIAFVNVYQSEIDIQVFMEVIGFQLLLCLILMAGSALAAKMLKLDRGMTANFKNSIVLLNSGNYGLPVSELVFQTNPLGMTIQIIVMTIQNFVTYTYGLFNSVAAKHDGKGIFIILLKMPILYALLLAVLFQAFQINIPAFIWNPIESASAAFLAIALLSLGAQIAYIKITKPDKVLISSIIGRLIVAPAIGLGLILLMGITGTTAQALLIASSFPASRNSAQLALEYDNYPESAGQIVLVTTILSSLTVTFVVYLAGVIF